MLQLKHLFCFHICPWLPVFGQKSQMRKWFHRLPRVLLRRCTRWFWWIKSSYTKASVTEVKICIFQPCLRRRSHDCLHSETCAQRGLSLVVGQCDGGSFYSLWAVNRQQERAGGADQLELLWRICSTRQTQTCTISRMQKHVEKFNLEDNYYEKSLSSCFCEIWHTSVDVCLPCMESYILLTLSVNKERLLRGYYRYWTCCKTNIEWTHQRKPQKTHRTLRLQHDLTAFHCYIKASIQSCSPKLDQRLEP